MKQDITTDPAEIKRIINLMRNKGGEKGIQRRKEEIKSSPFANDMILSLEISKILQKN